MELTEAIKTRRSIRRYKEDPVDDESLERCLEAARLAPSWANTQCWHFVIVRDSKTRAELAETLNETNPAIAAIKTAPVTIVACAEMGKSGFKSEEPGPATDKGDWFMFDVALAMQNLVLEAHQLGLGTVLVGRFDAPKVAAMLGLPDGLSVVAMTPLGHPDQQPNPRPRKELSEIVSREKYGRS